MRNTNGHFPGLRKWGLPALAVVALLGSGCATLGGASSTPEDTVRRFCELDFDGARLSGNTNPRMAPLVAWDSDPAMDPVYLVRSFEVGEARVEGNRAEVPVQYDVRGCIGVPWKPQGATVDEVEADLQANANVTFVLEQRGSSWKIVGPVVTPHASPEVLARVIRSWPQSGARGDDLRLHATLDYLDSLK